MKKIFIILYVYLKIMFGNCTGTNQISNYYANIPYVAEMPVKEDNELELSFD